MDLLFTTKRRNTVHTQYPCHWQTVWFSNPVSGTVHGHTKVFELLFVHFSPVKTFQTVHTNVNGVPLLQTRFRRDTILSGVQRVGRKDLCKPKMTRTDTSRTNRPSGLVLTVLLPDDHGPTSELPVLFPSKGRLGFRNSNVTKHKHILNVSDFHGVFGRSHIDPLTSPPRRTFPVSFFLRSEVPRRPRCTSGEWKSRVTV